MLRCLLTCSNNTNKLSPQELRQNRLQLILRSNNTNKLSPQEQLKGGPQMPLRSNNTNKLSPQEPRHILVKYCLSSNNTNKLSPQEQRKQIQNLQLVQIIQINLVLKNCQPYYSIFMLYLQYILSISIIKS